MFGVLFSTVYVFGFSAVFAVLCIFINTLWIIHQQESFCETPGLFKASLFSWLFLQREMHYWNGNAHKSNALMNGFCHCSVCLCMCVFVIFVCISVFVFVIFPVKNVQKQMMNFWARAWADGGKNLNCIFYFTVAHGRKLRTRWKMQLMFFSVTLTQREHFSFNLLECFSIFQYNPLQFVHDDREVISNACVLLTYRNVFYVNLSFRNHIKLCARVISKSRWCFDLANMRVLVRSCRQFTIFVRNSVF